MTSLFRRSLTSLVLASMVGSTLVVIHPATASAQTIAADAKRLKYDETQDKKIEAAIKSVETEIAALTKLEEKFEAVIKAADAKGQTDLAAADMAALTEIEAQVKKLDGQLAILEKEEATETARVKADEKALGAAEKLASHAKRAAHLAAHRKALQEHAAEIAKLKGEKSIKKHVASSALRKEKLAAMKSANAAHSAEHAAELAQRAKIVDQKAVAAAAAKLKYDESVDKKIEASLASEEKHIAALEKLEAGFEATVKAAAAKGQTDLAAADLASLTEVEKELALYESELANTEKAEKAEVARITADKTLLGAKEKLESHAVRIALLDERKAALAEHKAEIAKMKLEKDVKKHVASVELRKKHLARHRVAHTKHLAEHKKELAARPKP